jgi:hypothetical protein
VNSIRFQTSSLPIQVSWNETAVWNFWNGFAASWCSRMFPLILYSGALSPDQRERAEKAGVTAILTKGPNAVTMKEDMLEILSHLPPRLSRVAEVRGGLWIQNEIVEWDNFLRPAPHKFTRTEDNGRVHEW